MAAPINLPPIVQQFGLVTLLCLAWIFLVAGTAADWVVISYGGGSVSGNLWPDLSGCQGSNCSKFQAAEAFLTMAILFVSFAIICWGIVFIGKGNNMIQLGILGLTVVGFVFNLIGFAIGTNLVSQAPYATNGPGVGLTCLSWILLLFASVLAFLQYGGAMPIKTSPDGSGRPQAVATDNTQSAPAN